MLKVNETKAQVCHKNLVTPSQHTTTLPSKGQLITCYTLVLNTQIDLICFLPQETCVLVKETDIQIIKNIKHKI